MDNPYQRRWKFPDSEVYFSDFPDKPNQVGRSLFWYCVYCSQRFAEVQCLAHGKSVVWQGISSCCPNCPGNRFGIPGSLETALLVGKLLPPAYHFHQLSAEINFLDHKDHPYNAD